MTDFANEAEGPSWVPKIIGIIKVLTVVIVAIIVINSLVPRSGSPSPSEEGDPVSSTGMPPMWPMMPGGMWKTEKEIKSMMDSQTRVKERKDVL